MHIFIRTVLISCCLAGFAAAPVAADQVIRIKPRPGVFLKMLADDPGDAKAVAVLLPGGSGLVKIKNDATFKGTKGNFLTRSRKTFAGNGLITVLFDAPSDHRKGKGLTFAYRMTPEHATDINKAIRRLRQVYPGLPVWLVGTSRGSTSAANVAATIETGGPDGIVLMSSVGVATKHGGNVHDFDLAKIKIPVLVVNHLKDGCRLTAVFGAINIKAAMVNSTAAELLIVEGGSAGNGNPCKAKTHHGYQGIEAMVVEAIAGWIKSH